MLGKEIVDDILDEMRGRKGFDAAWDDCDSDVQEEIREEWINLVVRALENQ
jgi:hypothetical protein